MQQMCIKALLPVFIENYLSCCCDSAKLQLFGVLDWDGVDASGSLQARLNSDFGLNYGFICIETQRYQLSKRNKEKENKRSVDSSTRPPCVSEAWAWHRHACTSGPKCGDSAPIFG